MTNRRKLNPTKPQFVWRVETTAIDIPREFWRYAMPGFTRAPRVIWTRQLKIAQQISKMDDQAGGYPWPFQYEARRCLLCGQWRIGFGAQILRVREAVAWLNGEPIGACGPTCENARALAMLISDPRLSIKFLSDWPSVPESVAAASNLPPHLLHDLGFSGSAQGCRVGSHGGKATTDQREKLDIRLLQHAGYLTPGARFQVGQIKGQTRNSTLIVSRTAADSKNIHNVRQIQLLRTACNYGGERKWFRCPTKDCGRRVAILYWRGDVFACRQCCQLGYRSQREERCLLGLRRARAIRTRLGGGSPDLMRPFPLKPKGMHSKTYQQSQQEHDRLVDNLRREPRRSVLPFSSPELSLSDRLFIQMYVAIGELEKIPEYYPRFTLKKCRRLWTRPEIRAQCERYFELANTENACLEAKYNRLDPDCLKALIVDRVENATGMQRVKAIELGLKLTGVL